MSTDLNLVMRRALATVLVAAALVALPGVAAAQRCVGLPDDMRIVSVHAGFSGRDGAAGLGAAADLRVGRLLTSAEYRDLGGSWGEEQAAVQVALLPRPVERSPTGLSGLCPFVRYDRIDQSPPGPNVYPKGGEQLSRLGVGVAAGAEFETAFLRHILHVAPRVDAYDQEFRYADGSADRFSSGLVPGYAVGLTVQVPRLFEVRFLHISERPRTFYRSYFTIHVGASF